MVMATGFMRQLSMVYPGAEISVIVKKGLQDLLEFFPPTSHQFVFDKSQYKGVMGAKVFGKKIKSGEGFDLFFSLPNSFSAALMGYFTGAKKRTGYRNEGRGFLLTHAYPQREDLHRAQMYTALLEAFSGQKALATEVVLEHRFEKKEQVVVNINSEASSRRLTVGKAVELLDHLRSATAQKIILIGAPREKEFVDKVFSSLREHHGIENAAGATTLVQLARILAEARVMLSTDSGPAHLANALGTDTVVLFGAGKESLTAPFNAEGTSIIRLGELSCEPCQKNTCVRFETPQCLERLNTNRIIQTVKLHLPS